MIFIEFTLSEATRLEWPAMHMISDMFGEIGLCILGASLLISTARGIRGDAVASLHLSLGGRGYKITVLDRRGQTEDLGGEGGRGWLRECSNTPSLAISSTWLKPGH